MLYHFSSLLSKFHQIQYSRGICQKPAKKCKICVKCKKKRDGKAVSFYSLYFAAQKARDGAAVDLAAVFHLPCIAVLVVTVHVATRWAERHDRNAEGNG